MNHLDLFSGIGGFALAARWANIKTIAFCERDPFCQKVLAKHWPDVLCHADIIGFRGLFYRNQVDVLTAGFPCQPFSVAGKQKGKDDDRYLWPATMRAIEQVQPTWCILENVPGIIPYLDTILEDLEREGYSWQAYLIPASAVHAPHKRERLWIVANRDRERFDFGGYHWEERHFQDDWEQYIKTLQSEWTQFQPESWTTFNTQDWLESATNSTSERLQRAGSLGESLYSEESREGKADYAVNGSINTIFRWKKDQPPIPGVDDGIPNGLDRNKSLGNAIVPQIPYLFFMLIRYLSVAYRRLYDTHQSPRKYNTNT